jgi:hypothetical protein
MKINYFPFILLMSVFFMLSCKKTQKEEEVEVKKIATEYLRDFYYNDYQYAKAYGTESTKKFLVYLEKNDKKDYRNHSFTEIDSVLLEGKERDSAFVYYSYENSFYTKDKSVLPLIKKQNQWLVNIENKNNLDFYRVVFDYSCVEIETKNYQKLNNEELIEVELITSTFIKQVDHPKLVVGLLNASSLLYYDIKDIEHFNDNHVRLWEDLSTMSVNSSFYFNNDKLLTEFEYFIYSINSSNSFGVIEKIELILTKHYGQPFNKIPSENGKWYKTLRWFTKGGNEIIELTNNEDNSVTLKVIDSENDTETY